MNNISISIIIPAYNEEQRLGNTLRSIISYLSSRNYEFEIIVVDDGSNDKTQMVFLDIVKENPKQKLKYIKNKLNHGKGYVVRQGMLQASKDYIFFTDADLSTPIYEIEKLLTALKGNFDITIGSRAINRSLVHKHQPWYRELIGRLFNFLAQVWLIPGIKDSQCGFKGFKKKVVSKIFSNQILDSFVFDVEILYIAKKLNYSIAEIPVEWINNEDTKFKTNFKNFMVTWKDLYKIRFLH